MKRFLSYLLLFSLALSFCPCAEAAVDTKFTEEFSNIVYKVSDKLRRVDYSEGKHTEYVYYADKTNSNCIMTILLKADNEIYTQGQVEEYMDIFAEGFFCETNGFSSADISAFAADVPARHVSCKSGDDTSVDAYCFYAGEDKVLIIGNWKLKGSKTNLSKELEALVDSLEIDGVSFEEKKSEEKSSLFSSNNSGSVGFTNKYGSPTTRCAKAGCSYYIASSGDTNCCVKHSNKCLECKKYIDGDAMYCMDCLSGSITSSGTTKSSGSGSYGTNKSSGGCKYTYSNGSVCGAKCASGMTLCTKHFNELYEIYSSFTS